MELIIKLLANTISVFVFGYILPGIQVRSFGSSLLIAILLALMNAFVQSVVILFNLPVTIYTIAVSILVSNTFIVLLGDLFMDGIKAKTSGWAVLFSLLLMLVNVLFFYFQFFI